MTITEYKNRTEVTGVFNSLEDVKQSSIGWLETYQDIDNESYQEEINTIRNTNDLTVVNDLLQEYGYSYVTQNK
ncbi:hypothetical protein [Mammaliicoccus sciuri]|uniref:hypothetical protein n=1 Tax=Mammaliicoccus sciuri TaxID=1296 RepID=UPI002B256D14|nr:hypothetical protein [Mammaliicoccus sciuri]WQK75195.1 hypothetical protein P3U33_05555 [Mammaliicoccus sciuri]